MLFFVDICMTEKDYICDYINNSIDTKKRILDNDNFIDLTEKIAQKIIAVYKDKKKVLIAGNGGSASDAQHLAAELVGKFLKERIPLNAVALTTNVPVLTAIGNDCSFEDIFARQIDAIGEDGDVFVAISTSGNSKNIIKAIKSAKNKNIFVIGFTGQKSCEMDNLCDYILKVPSENTPHIQESHIMLGHLICSIVEKELFD